MTEKEVTIKNRAGIHARPAALIVQTASKFNSKIHMIKDNEKVNAKSIMGIITLELVTTQKFGFKQRPG
jgi:phosphocarrier protein